MVGASDALYESGYEAIESPNERLRDQSKVGCGAGTEALYDVGLDANDSS